MVGIPGKHCFYVNLSWLAFGLLHGKHSLLVIFGGYHLVVDTLVWLSVVDGITFALVVKNTLFGYLWWMVLLLFS